MNWLTGPIKTRYNIVLYRKQSIDHNRASSSMDTRMDEAYERKKRIYNELSWWSVWCYHVEVGCHWFVGKSTIRAPRQIGKRKKEKNAINKIGDVAAKTSSRVWLRRSESQCEPNSLHVSRGGTASPWTRRIDIAWWSKCRNNQRRPLHH